MTGAPWFSSANAPRSISSSRSGTTFPVIERTLRQRTVPLTVIWKRVRGTVHRAKSDARSGARGALQAAPQVLDQRFELAGPLDRAASFPRALLALPSISPEVEAICLALAGETSPR